MRSAWLRQTAAAAVSAYGDLVDDAVDLNSSDGVVNAGHKSVDRWSDAVAEVVADELTLLQAPSCIVMSRWWRCRFMYMLGREVFH
jgi:hypothetical protein